MSWEVNGVNAVEVAAGVITRQDKLLIAERPHSKPYNGYWEFPGGKLDPPESAKQALHRELQEELGITIQSCHHLFDHTYDYPTRKVNISFWHVTGFDGEPQGKEEQALAWVEFIKLTNYPLLPANLIILPLLQKRLRCTR